MPVWKYQTTEGNTGIYIYQTAIFLDRLMLEQRLILKIFYSYTDVSISG